MLYSFSPSDYIWTEKYLVNSKQEQVRHGLDGERDGDVGRCQGMCAICNFMFHAAFILTIWKWFLLQDFEKGRIRALQEERLYIQKKTFTKWMNSFLQKAKMEVEDLFIDLADGRKLLKLLEIISGERMIYNFISL